MGPAQHGLRLQGIGPSLRVDTSNMNECAFNLGLSRMAYVVTAEMLPSKKSLCASSSVSTRASAPSCAAVLAFSTLCCWSSAAMYPCLPRAWTAGLRPIRLHWLRPRIELRESSRGACTPGGVTASERFVSAARSVSSMRASSVATKITACGQRQRKARRSGKYSSTFVTQRLERTPFNQQRQRASPSYAQAPTRPEGSRHCGDTSTAQARSVPRRCSPSTVSRARLSPSGRSTPWARQKE
jgi:hypothetical protein